MNIERVSFEGHACIRMTDRGQTLTVTTDVGPRVLGFSGRGDNFMAVLPGAKIETPGLTPFTFYGGHRLWVAPEEPALTYEPDDAPCEVSEVPGGVRVTAAHAPSGIARSLEITAGDSGWSVLHGVANDGDADVDVAPWGITQVRLGGKAFLPMPPVGEPPKADRALVMWPYTHLTDGRLRFEDGGVEVDGVPGPPLKLGAAPGAGWLSYRIDGEEFRVSAADASGRVVPDRGAAMQVFTCEAFLELETVGALVRLRAGEKTEHLEAWTLEAA